MAIVQNNYWEANEGKDMGNEEKTQKKKKIEKGREKKNTYLRWLQRWGQEREVYQQ